VSSNIANYLVPLTDMKLLLHLEMLCFIFNVSSSRNLLTFLLKIDDVLVRGIPVKESQEAENLRNMK
jgi:hypothetical protein